MLNSKRAFPKSLHRKALGKAYHSGRVSKIVEIVSASRGFPCTRSLPNWGVGVLEDKGRICSRRASPSQKCHFGRRVDYIVLNENEVRPLFGSGRVEKSQHASSALKMKHGGRWILPVRRALRVRALCVVDALAHAPKEKPYRTSDRALNMRQGRRLTSRERQGNVNVRQSSGIASFSCAFRTSIGMPVSAESFSSLFSVCSAAFAIFSSGVAA